MRHKDFPVFAGLQNASGNQHSGAAITGKARLAYDVAHVKNDVCGNPFQAFF